MYDGVLLNPYKLTVRYNFFSPFHLAITVRHENVGTHNTSPKNNHAGNILAEEALLLRICNIQFSKRPF